MKKVIFLIVCLSFPFLGISAINATNEFDLPITENGYIKEFWSISYMRGKGYLSVGMDNSVYKEGRTRTYLRYDLTPFIEKQLNSDQIEKATLYLTYYRADRNAPTSINVLINPLDHEPSKVRRPWPSIPPLTSDTIQMALPKARGVRELDITDIVRKQIAEVTPKPGIYITAQNEDLLGSYYYSNQCQTATLHYKPYCLPGAEPKLTLTIAPQDPVPASLHQTEAFGNTLSSLPLSWSGPSTQLYKVEFGTSPSFEEVLYSSDWRPSLSYQDNPTIYQTYFWRVLSKLDPTSDEIALSNIGRIDLFNTKEFQPLIEEMVGGYSISNSPKSNYIRAIWEVSPTPNFTKIEFIDSETIQNEQVCEGERSAKFLRAHLQDVLDSTSKVSNVILHLCNTDSPMYFQSEVGKSSTPEKESRQELEPKELKPQRNEISKAPHEGTSIYKKSPTDSQLNKINCTETHSILTFLRKKECQKVKLKLLSIENLQIDMEQYWIRASVKLPNILHMTTYSGFCKVVSGKLPFRCKVQKDENFKPHFVFTSLIGKRAWKPYLLSSTEEGIYTLLFSAAEDLNKREFQLTASLVLPHTIDTPHTTRTEGIIPSAKKPEYLENDFSFPFSKTIGVTQWHGVTNYSKPHTGIDFGSLNEEVKAIGDGKVVTSKYDDFNGQCLSGGYYLTIRHSSGKHSTYMHLKEGSIKKNPGEEVSKGDVIATSGNTGSYNCQPLGHHLHLETRLGQKQSTHTNPVNMIEYDWDLVPTLGYNQYPGRLSGENPHPGR